MLEVPNLPLQQNGQAKCITMANLCRGTTAPMAWMGAPGLQVKWLPSD